MVRKYSSHRRALTAVETSSFRFSQTSFGTVALLGRRSGKSIVHSKKRSRRSFAFAVTSFNYPIQRALRILPDGTLDAIWPEHRATRSQDLEPAYHDAGQFYWGRTSAFRERREVFSPESTPVVPPRERTHDIDTPEDWANAELAFAALPLTEGRRL